MRFSIVAMVLVSVLVMLVPIIFNYGQAAMAQQASPPSGIPLADNSSNLRNNTNNTVGTNATQPTH